MKIKRIIFISILGIFSVAKGQDLSSGLLERSEVPEKYKWNTSDVYSDVESWNRDFSWIEQELPGYESYEGRLGESAATLLECFLFDEKVKRKLDYIWLYAKLNRDVEMQNQKAQVLWARYNRLNARVEAARSFITPELLSLPDGSIEKFLTEEPGLSSYNYYFSTLQQKKKHTLASEREEFLAKLSPILENPYNVFGSLVYDELPFPVIQDDRGEDIQLNRSTSWRARSSQDRPYRKAGYQGYYNSLSQYQATLTRNLSAYIEWKVLMAKTRNYRSALEASLDRSGLPVEVYYTLLESVGKNLEPCHRWMKLKKDLLELDTLHLYDTRVTMFPAFEKKITWEEAEKLTMESLQILGEGYLGELRKMYKNRWIDAFPNVGKETGGYNSGPAGPHPYVKMNWGEGLFDFYTLVHELGHYVHSVKAMDSQPYIYWEYPPFLSEVASTTAENISQIWLIQNADNKEEKLYHMEKYMDNLILYIYNTAMMAEFELLLYETVEAGESLSPQELNENYGTLLAKYYGPGLNLDLSDSYAWMEYPHYYLDYYLYSYASSFAAALQIASDINNEGGPAIDRFIRFLEEGNSDRPVEILKRAGADMTKAEPYETVTQRMNELMDEMELLLQSN